MAKTRLVLDDPVHLLPHLELLAEVLGDRLDHEVAVGQVAVVGGALDAPAHRVGVGLLQLALLHRAAELLLDLADALVERRLVDLAQHHVVAGLRRHLGDAVAHQARSQHSNLLDLHYRPSDPSFRAPGAYMSLVRSRRPRRRPPPGPPARREAQRLQRRADRGPRARARGGGGRPVGPRAWWCAATAPMFSSGHGPQRPARALRGPVAPAPVPPPDPDLVEPARGDAQAHHLPDPRRLPGRGVRAGAGGRLPRDGGGRDGRDHGGAGGAAARRGRLLAPAGRSSAWATPRS